MGFLLTVIYISLALLSPADLFPSLAEYRVQVVFAMAALLFSLPGLLSGSFFRTPQMYLLTGLFGAIFLSQAIGGHWPGGGLVAISEFLPSAIVFYLIILNCRSWGRLEVLAVVIAAIATFYVVQGARAYFANDVGSAYLFTGPVSNSDDAEMGIARIRGLGVLHDPNDLAQFLVMTIPFFWMRWQAGRKLRNVMLVLVPTSFLVFGIYLTHSRGAMLALLVILLLGLRDRLGLMGSIVIVAAALAVFLAMDFSGGRDISLEAGQDRMEFWANALQLFKSSPVFGIGYENFTGENGGHTAHNSFVLCLAELGIIGYSLWMGLLVFTAAGLNSVVSSKRRGRLPEEGTTLQNVEIIEVNGEAARIDRWAKTLLIAMAGFLAAAWFLSRAYTPSLYLLLGMSAAFLSLTAGETEPIARQPSARLVALTGMAGVGVIAFLYAWLRIRSAL
jgi:hypothetical protein